MNTKSIRFILGWILNIEALLMLLPVATAVVYREEEGIAYALVMAVCAAVGALMTYKKPNNPSFYAKEGFVCTALGWILMSAFGCVPFMLTGEIPSFVDAMFEMVSGFTTTGASVVLNVEELSHCTNMWRCFSHWIGGMGILVFLLAVLPLVGGSNMQLMKAESPGPSVGKLVPKVRFTARILYVLYVALTVLQVLVMLLLIRCKADYRIDCRDLHITRSILSKICAIGIPSALQLAITAFSNMFVQSYINRFESSCMAGWTACSKVDSFALLPMMSLSVAITTFVGQNLGAGNYERARSGAKSGLVIGLIIMAVVLVPLYIFAPQIVTLFNKEAEVVEFGGLFIRIVAPFYLMFAINQVYSGALRGAGDTRSTMFIMLGSFVVFRQVYLFAVYKLGGGIDAIVLGYPAGWVLCSILLLIYYYRGGWFKKLQAGIE